MTLGALAVLWELLEVPAWLLESIIGMLVILCVVGLQFFEKRLKIQDRVPYSMLIGFWGGCFALVDAFPPPCPSTLGVIVSPHFR